MSFYTLRWLPKGAVVHVNCSLCGKPQVQRQAKPDLVSVWHACDQRPPGPMGRPGYCRISETTFIGDLPPESPQ